MSLNHYAGDLERVASAENSSKLGRSFTQHPHDLYRLLRVDAPAHRVVMLGGRHAWLVTRCAEATAALNNPRLSKNCGPLMDVLPWGSSGPRWSLVNSNILQEDSPEHTRLCHLVSRALTARRLQKMRPATIRIADELLDGVAVTAAAGDAVDLMQSYAVPLTLRVINDLLGVPSGEADSFRTHIEPLFTSTDAAELGATEYALTNLLDGLITHKRARPADDLFSALVHTCDGKERLSDDELVLTALLLILAGYDTSVHLIRHGVLALLHNPSRLSALRADPSLLPGAVEEFLLFESPLNVATARLTTGAVRIGEVKIPPGQLVLVSLLSANHGTPRYDNADRVDLTPTSTGHFAFGSDIKHCLGGRLARLEGEITISRLLERFGRITLADNSILRHRNNVVMPGLTTLPVRLDA